MNDKVRGVEQPMCELALCALEISMILHFSLCISVCRLYKGDLITPNTGKLQCFPSLLL